MREDAADDHGRELADAVAEAQPRLADRDLEDLLEDASCASSIATIVATSSAKVSSVVGASASIRAARSIGRLTASVATCDASSSTPADDRPEDRVRQQLGAPAQVGLVVSPEGKARRYRSRAEVAHRARRIPAPRPASWPAARSQRRQPGPDRRPRPVQRLALGGDTPPPTIAVLTIAPLCRLEEHGKDRPMKSRAGTRTGPGGPGF